MKRNSFWWLVPALVLWGCGGSSGVSGEVPDPFVRFFNASPNSAALDFYLNETQLGNNVPYLGSQPNFAQMEPGTYDVICQEDANPETQAIETFNFQRDQSLGCAAVGLVTPPNDEDDKRMRITTFLMDRTRPNGNKARISVVHAYNRAVGLITPQIDFQNPGNNPVLRLTGIDFAATRETLIDAGSQQLVARRSGTEFEVTPIKTFNFEAGKIYVALVTGIEDEVGAKAPKIEIVEVQVK